MDSETRVIDIALRQKAIVWWGLLSNTKKNIIAQESSFLIGFPRNPQTLTGREIQQIYEHKKNEL